MKKITLVLAGMGVTLLFATELVLADGGAIQTMARITLSLNHFPSDDDKAELQDIIDSDDSTEDEADIAMAIADIQHKVSKKDAARLADIINDDSAEAEARELAGIVLRINHSAGDKDKAALSALAAE